VRPIAIINLLELTLSSSISLIQQWIKSHPDGIIHPSLRIGREIPGDSSSLLGLFVNSQDNPIEKGDIIAQIPWDQLSTYYLSTASSVEYNLLQNR
jgi:hypothetical protein